MKTWRRVVCGVLVMTLVAAGVTLWSRDVYKQWPWSDYPDPLTWCGGDWVPATVQTRQQIQAGFVGFHRAGDLPGLLNSGSVWTGRDRAGGTGFTECHVSEVWVQLGPDRFEAMDVEGDP